MTDSRFICLRVTSTGILLRTSDGNESGWGQVGRAARGRRADAQASIPAIEGGAPAGGIAVARRLPLVWRPAKSEQIVESLGALRRTIGRKLPAIRDGAGCQKSRQVGQWLEARNGRIAIVFLPPCAPDWNPVEAICPWQSARSPTCVLRAERLRTLAPGADAASPETDPSVLAGDRTGALRGHAPAGSPMVRPNPIREHM